MTPGYWPDLVWGDLAVVLIEEGKGRYVAPAGTTLRVVSPTESPIAEYDFSTQTWWIGHAAPVESRQLLILHGMIPPGSWVVRDSVGSFRGVSFFLMYPNGVSTGLGLA